jgi:hypothetical protein
MSDENFISRWSRRKIAARQAPEKADEPPARAELPQQEIAAVPAPPPEPVPLPPVESLTSESDFTPFMQPNVDAGVKRQALKKLFDDPRFNAMDGLDVYIDDYTKTTPIPEGLLEKMEQWRHLGIFKREPVVPEEPVSGGEEKTPPEQKVAATPSITSKEEISSPPVGESEVSRG